MLLARRLARVETTVILDVHGDWRSPTRLYGSPLRRALSPLADALARLALRHADAVRTITAYTSELVRAEGVEPVAEFPAFMDLEPFTGPTVPLPERPLALFIGVLERYKAIDVLADAWRRAAPQVPGARAAHRRPRHDVRGRELARARPAGPDAVDRGASDGGDRRSARRGDRSRPPVPLGGHGACARGGLLPGPGRRRQPRRRHPRSRRRRRQRRPEPSRRRRRPSRRRSSPCSATPRSRVGSARERPRARRPGSRRPSSSRRACASSSTSASRGSDPRLPAMRLEHPKQLVKNSVYRSLGEVTIRTPRKTSPSSPSGCSCTTR